MKLYVEQLTNVDVEAVPARERKATVALQQRAEKFVLPEKGEFNRFVGALLAMGVVTKPTMRSYWYDETPFETPQFRDMMGYNRFFDILRFLHLADRENADKHDPISLARPALDLFTQNLRDVYTPSRYLSVDEEILPHRGRHKSRQYCQGKNRDYGFKFHNLNEPNGYVCNMKLYTGAAFAQSPPPGLLKTEAIVLELCEHLSRKGYIITVDRGFASVNLCEELHAKGFHSLGNVLQSRRNFPAELRTKPSRSKKKK